MSAIALVPGHLGALHPVEQVLTILVAFGPFLVLGVVVAVRRRQDAAEKPGEPVDDQRAGGQRER